MSVRYDDIKSEISILRWYFIAYISKYNHCYKRKNNDSFVNSISIKDVFYKSGFTHIFVWSLAKILSEKINSVFWSEDININIPSYLLYKVNDVFLKSLP